MNSIWSEKNELVSRRIQVTYKDFFFFKVAEVFIKLSGIKEQTAENTLK